MPKDSSVWAVQQGYFVLPRNVPNIPLILGREAGSLTLQIGSALPKDFAGNPKTPCALFLWFQKILPYLLWMNRLFPACGDQTAIDTLSKKWRPPLLRQKKNIHLKILLGYSRPYLWKYRLELPVDMFLKDSSGTLWKQSHIGILSH